MSRIIYLVKKLIVGEQDAIFESNLPVLTKRNIQMPIETALRRTMLAVAALALAACSSSGSGNDAGLACDITATFDCTPAVAFGLDAGSGGALADAGIFCTLAQICSGNITTDGGDTETVCVPVDSNLQCLSCATQCAGDGPCIFGTRSIVGGTPETGCACGCQL